MKSAKVRGRKAPAKVEVNVPESQLSPEDMGPSQRPVAPDEPAFFKGPLGSADVDSLSGVVLREYARRAGVSPRDIEFLTEDRLRQNTKLTIQNHFDLIAEG